jgi:hypothetical protein
MQINRRLQDDAIGIHRAKTSTRSGVRRWPVIVIAASFILTALWIGFIAWQACRAALSLIFG